MCKNWLVYSEFKFYVNFLRYLDLFELSDTAKHSTIKYYEKSTSYFSDENAPTRIKHLIPKVKLIAFIGNPIELAYSIFQVKYSNYLS